MYVDKGGADKIRYVVCVHKMAGNQADQVGTLAHRATKITNCTDRNFSNLTANMFPGKSLIDYR